MSLEQGAKLPTSPVTRRGLCEPLQSPRPTCTLKKLIHKVFEGAGVGHEACDSVEVVEGNEDVLGVPCHVHHLADRVLVLSALRPKASQLP